jgi:streptogramin lyase
VLVLAGAVGAVVVLTRSNPSAPVVVPTNSVALIDAQHNRIASFVGVGRRPVALATDANGVWVVNADDGTVDELDPITGKLLHTIGIGSDVNDLAVGFGSVWVADGNDGTLTRIDATTGQVQRTLQLAQPGTLAPTTVFFVATDRRYVWTTLADALLRIDPATNRVSGRVTVGAPSTLTAGGGSVWVTTISERLVRIDARSLRITASSDLSNGPVAAALGGNALWLVYGYSGALNAVDPLTLAVSSLATGLEHVVTVAVGAGSVWVADSAGGVQRLNEANGKVTATLQVGGMVSAIALQSGRAWIAVIAAT